MKKIIIGVVVGVVVLIGAVVGHFVAQRYTCADKAEAFPPEYYNISCLMQSFNSRNDIGYIATQYNERKNTISVYCYCADFAEMATDPSKWNDYLIDVEIARNTVTEVLERPESGSKIKTFDIVIFAYPSNTSFEPYTIYYRNKYGHTWDFVWDKFLEKK